MFEKIANLVAEIMNVSPQDITPETPLRAEDGLEPMEFARLIIAAEKKFSLPIYDIDAAAFFTVRDMQEYLEANTRSEEKKQDDDSPIDVEEYFYSE